MVNPYAVECQRVVLRVASQELNENNIVNVTYVSTIIL
jgi:hypothetical protein